MTHNSSPSHYSRAPRWVVRRKDLSTNAKAVFWALLDRANADDECWPSHRRIADDLGVSVSTVRRALKELADVGAVTVSQRSNEAGGNSSSLFRLHVDGPRATSGAPQNLHPPVHGRTGPLFTGEQAPCSPVSAEVIPIEEEPIEDFYHRRSADDGDILDDIPQGRRTTLRGQLTEIGGIIASGSDFLDEKVQLRWDAFVADVVDATEDAEGVQVADALHGLLRDRWSLSARVADPYRAGRELNLMLATARNVGYQDRAG